MEKLTIFLTTALLIPIVTIFSEEATLYLTPKVDTPFGQSGPPQPDKPSEEATVSVQVPFGKTALWVWKNKLVKACSNMTCHEFLRLGVQQAVKYSLNNAKLALLNSEEREDTGKQLKTIDILLKKAKKMDETNIDKKWNKRFKKFVKKAKKLFRSKKFKKALNESTAVIYVSKANIGLQWKNKSVELPVVDPADGAKALKEWKVKSTNGMVIPRIGFGTRGLSGEKCREAVLAALKTGYRYIDTSQTYKNDAEIGAAIREAVDQGIIKSRDEIFISHKISDPKDYDGNLTVKRCEEQLRLLNTSYIDVYMLHGPQNETVNKEAWKALQRLHNASKIKHLGVANFDDSNKLVDIYVTAEVKPDYHQNKFSVYHPGGQMRLPYNMVADCEKVGMPFVGYSTLAAFPYVLSPMRDPHVKEIAKKYNRTTAQILLRWALQLNTIIIPKSSQPKRIEENAKVVEFKLDEIDMRLLNGLSTLFHSTFSIAPKFVDDVYGLFPRQAATNDLLNALLHAQHEEL